MLKSEAVVEIAKRTSLSKAQAHEAYNALEEIWKDTIYKGDGEIPIIAGVKLKVVVADPRKSRNPKTGEEFTLPERKIIKLKTSPAFRKKLADEEIN